MLQIASYFSPSTMNAILTTALYSTILLFSTFALHRFTQMDLMFLTVFAASASAFLVASSQSFVELPTSSIIFTTAIFLFSPKYYAPNCLLFFTPIRFWSNHFLQRPASFQYHMSKQAGETALSCFRKVSVTSQIKTWHIRIASMLDEALVMSLTL